MTKLEKKYNATRIASSGNLESLAKMGQQYLYCEALPTFEEQEDGTLRMRTPRGKLTNLFVIKSGKWYYLLSPGV